MTRKAGLNSLWMIIDFLLMVIAIGVQLSYLVFSDTKEVWPIQVTSFAIGIGLMLSISSSL